MGIVKLIPERGCMTCSPFSITETYKIDSFPGNNSLSLQIQIDNTYDRFISSGRNHDPPFIDFTRLRKISFFEDFPPGEAKHTAMAYPYSEDLRNILIETAKELNLRYHERGTVVTIEGPRFSTRAESEMFRIWGADVINMSIAPETILANEAGIPYAAVAMSTDYDCWKDDEAPVTWEEILEIFGKNVNNVIALLSNSIKKIK